MSNSTVPRNIYFSGSIRGGRQHAQLYHELIEELKNYGTVLTEHIGASNVDSHSKSDQEIYSKDIEWLQEADIIIGEVSTPSLGVGFEIGQAVALGKDIICLYQREFEESISAMIKGSPTVKCFPYSNIMEAKKILSQILKN